MNVYKESSGSRKWEFQTTDGARVCRPGSRPRVIDGLQRWGLWSSDVPQIPQWYIRCLTFSEVSEVYHKHKFNSILHDSSVMVAIRYIYSNSSYYHTWLSIWILNRTFFTRISRSLCMSVKVEDTKTRMVFQPDSILLLNIGSVWKTAKLANKRVIYRGYTRTGECTIDDLKTRKFEISQYFYIANGRMTDVTVR